jgi:hypothetical protein
MLTLTLTSIMLAATAGCNDDAVTVAREAADRQAQQNETMAELQQEVAAGTRQLVAEEGQARRQALEVLRDLQAERGQLADGWDELESQRQSIARSRRTESLLATVLPASGGVAAAAVALAFAWMALYGLKRQDDSVAVACELLIEELLDEPPSDRWFPLPRAAGKLLSDERSSPPLTAPEPRDPTPTPEES